MKWLKRFLPLLVFFALAACTGRETKPQAEANPFERFVQQQRLEAVDKVRAFRLAGWQPLDDRWMLVDAAPARPYLLRLSIPCTELRWANHVVIRQTLPRVLQADFDHVHVPNSPEIRCTIDEIYPLSKEQAEALRALR